MSNPFPKRLRYAESFDAKGIMKSDATKMNLNRVSQYDR